VDDLAAAHIQAMEYLDQGGTSDAFNLGGGRGTSVTEILTEVQIAVGKAVPSVVEPRRPGDAAHLVSDCKRAETNLGWQTRHSDLENIVSSAWAWHRGMGSFRSAE